MLGVMSAVTGCALVEDAAGVRGSGEIATETRTLSGFTGIQLRGSGAATVEVTRTESVTIEADDNLMPFLTSEVVNGRLVLGTSESIVPTRQVVYTITLSSLEGVSIDGSGSLAAEGIEAHTFEVSISGSGSFVFAELDTETLIVDVNGSGVAEGTGTVADLRLSLSGSGSFIGDGLEADTATIEMSGSGSVAVNVSDRLDVSLNGSGSVSYIGDPTVTTDINGSGSVSPG